MDRLVVLMMLFLLVDVFFFNILLSVFGFFFNIYVVLSVFGKILNGYLWGIVIFIISKYNIYY